MYNLPKNFTVTAHTGCEGTADNSIESIKVGCENADIIEIDLSFTKKNEPVLAHDTIKEDAVTIDEAFALFAKYENVKMNIDCKTVENLKAVYESALKYGIENRIFYTGIEINKTGVAKRDTPKVPYYLNKTFPRFKLLKKSYIDSVIEDVKKSDAIGINTSYRACTKKLVDRFRDEGLSVSLYTCNSKSAMIKALKMGPDNITTRNPKKLKEFVSEMR